MGQEDTPLSITSDMRELAAGLSHADFRRIWQHAKPEQAEQGFLAACYEIVAKQANSEGEYYLAHDSANHGLRCAAASGFPPHRLVAAKTTALARSGATQEAQRVLDEFQVSQQPDGSISSAQARLLRDRALEAEGVERSELMLKAAHWASQAKEYARREEGDWLYPANQEAQFLFFAGRHDEAQKQAKAVIKHIEGGPDAGSMWNQTNLAEMSLVLGEVEQAGEHYAKATDLGVQSPGDLAANRAVALLLLAEQEGDSSVLNQWFPKPTVLIFSGHIPDGEGRATPRLPESVCRPEGPASRALAAQVAKLGAVEGISAGAPGGDVLFAEVIGAAGGRTTIIEPFSRERIREVAEASGHDWSSRLESVYQHAGHIQAITCAEDMNEDAQCDYANQVMLGAAQLRTKRIHGRLHAVVLWDESDRENPKPGGTGHFVQLCLQAGVPIDIINSSSLSS